MKGMAAAALLQANSAGICRYTRRCLLLFSCLGLVPSGLFHHNLHKAPGYCAFPVGLMRNDAAAFLSASPSSAQRDCGHCTFSVYSRLSCTHSRQNRHRQQVTAQTLTANLG